MIVDSPWRATLPWWYSVSQITYEDNTEPICKLKLLNKIYVFTQQHQKIDNKEVLQFYRKQLTQDRERVKADFIKTFHSIVWMTYRKNFTSMTTSATNIPKALQTDSDTGWGCMIRGGQMLLSNVILRHLFSTDFCLSMLNENNDARVKYLSLLWQFMDNGSGSEAAFSIGNIVEVGIKYGIKPKDWYGPSSIIQILNELNDKHAPFTDFKTVAFPEGVIYKDVVLSKACDIAEENVCVDKITEKNWKNSVAVLVGFRLGLDTINPEHHAAIFRLFDFPQFTGMVGGQGKGALYFVGYQDKELIFLDPHVTQSAVPKVVDLWTKHLTYHYSTPLKLHIDKLDTCVAYGMNFFGKSCFY